MTDRGTPRFFISARIGRASSAEPACPHAAIAALYAEVPTFSFDFFKHDDARARILFTRKRDDKASLSRIFC